jgi:hypothetical protein
LEEVLVFEAPVAAARSFLLHLPGLAVGEAGTLRFSFPRPKDILEE